MRDGPEAGLAKGLPPILVFAVEVAKWSDGTVHSTTPTAPHIRVRDGFSFDNRFNTPKAFAKLSPGLERSDNPGGIICMCFNPERVNPAQA